MSTAVAPVPPPHRTVAGAALLLWTGAAVAAPSAPAAEADTLVERVNDYRAQARQCEGREREPAGPLAPDPRLAEVDLAGGGSIREALRAVGYNAAAAQTIAIAGPDDAASAMDLVRQRYCAPLMDPQFAEIGAAHDGARWQIVLARPLLSEDLGDWQEAGRAVLEQVNAARAQARSCGGRHFDAAGPLTWDAALAEAALAHSRGMAERNVFSHRGGDGSEVGARATRAGYAWRHVGENIAAGQGAPEQVVAGWLSSPGHCANIMDPQFTEMGAAYATDPDSDAVSYWTQVFGAPR
ncbi:CAP domain-containing protein [Coralloluteibacterium stylophorae]|uniref:CAP domain-containing protein n=1 Tax=Coralloluteibacterium stylophorae TaxID=1776034 RepID=A0A8J7VSR1_9GAMM|nr:CAP domain-containing protein [Coralloluteibacterium stylophorae]MBS7456934.1 CAP domain-containing protein [Coralloluteibacterium stylophorae]